MKRYISLILILVMIFISFTSCNGREDDNTTIPTVENEVNRGNLKLAYSKNDSLNPYEAQTQMNIQICSLVYDSLYITDNNCEPVPVIAKSAIASGRTVNVTINDCKFSDGTAVTVNDIIYSYNLAKESKVFSTRLSNFIAANISSNSMLMFTLESPDPYAVSCLDFPIIRDKTNVVTFTNPAETTIESNYNESSTKKDDDVNKTPPIGSGKYKYAFDGEHVYLVVNTNKSGFNPYIKTISLISVHDSDSAQGSLVIGNTAFYYDELNEGIFNRINATNVEVYLNNMVFMCFNKDTSFFLDANIRQAINYSISRGKMCSVSFCNHARPASLPFNPDWYALNSFKSLTEPDYEKAKELVSLSEIDIKSRNLTLLYNSDNDFKTDAAKSIKYDLEKVGFIVNLYGVDSENISNEIRDGHYDLYIGEVKLTKNMNLSPVFKGLSNFDYSAYSDSAVKYNDFMAGNCELMDFINEFNLDIPFIPLCFRNAVASYTNSMSADFISYESDVFYDIATWRTK